MMKLKIILNIFILTFLLMGCEEVQDENVENNGSIVGDWRFEYSNYLFEVKTPNQEAQPHFNLLTAGGIDVSGVVESTLKYMEITNNVWGSYDFSLSSIYTKDELSYPYYTLNAYGPDYAGGYFSIFTYYHNQDSSHYYVSSRIDYQIDASNYTIIVTPSTLYQVTNQGLVDSSLSVEISGAIQNQITVIPPDTSIALDLDYLVGGWLSEFDLSFSDTGRFSAQSHTSSIEGYWTVRDSGLEIVEINTAWGYVHLDTVYYDYMIANDSLTIINYDDSRWSEIESVLLEPEFIWNFDGFYSDSMRHIKVRTYTRAK
jgi:hypothetical protein